MLPSSFAIVFVGLGPLVFMLPRALDQYSALPAALSPVGFRPSARGLLPEAPLGRVGLPGRVVAARFKASASWLALAAHDFEALGSPCIAKQDGQVRGGLQPLREPGRLRRG